MKLEIKNNQFIEIEELIKVNKFNCSIDSYTYENKTLKGEFIIQGEYIKDSSCFEEPFNFFKKLPFEIMFLEDINNIVTIEITEIEYFEVERRGVETELTLSLIYNDERVEQIESTDSPIYEDIKNDAINYVEEILDNTFINQNASSNGLPTSERKRRVKLL